MEVFRFVKARSVHSISEIQRDLATGFYRHIELGWILELWNEIDDDYFVENRELQFEINEVMWVKKILCQRQVWREFYVFLDCMCYRFAKQFPDLSFREARRHSRWLQRQMNRPESKEMRSAISVLMSTPFDTSLNQKELSALYSRKRATRAGYFSCKKN